MRFQSEKVTGATNRATIEAKKILYKSLYEGGNIFWALFKTRRLFENIEAPRGLGLGERFLRMWEFYLCYCEAGFEERQTGLVQVLFEKPEARSACLLGRFS